MNETMGARSQHKARSPSQRIELEKKGGRERTRNGKLRIVQGKSVISRNHRQVGESNESPRRKKGATQT